MEWLTNLVWRSTEYVKMAMYGLRLSANSYIQALDIYPQWDLHPVGDSNCQAEHENNDDYFGPKPEVRRKKSLDPALIQVREGILVVGYQRDAVQAVKAEMAALVSQPLALESLHVKSDSDVTDGALLVPKLALVANHQPGRKLIDSEDDRGQLDMLYDEACSIGADIMVVYLNLPKAVYKPLRHMIYHPRMSDIVFPDQPILRHLAEENCLITVVGHSDLTSMQKNVLREWMTNPVTASHPVYSRTAEYLSSLDLTPIEPNCLQDTAQRGSHTDSEVTPSQQPEVTEYATEEHPVLDRKRGRKGKKKMRFRKRREVETERGRTIDLVPLHESFDADMDESLEMDVYTRPTTAGYGSLDSWNANIGI